jgi:hypothetical protein
VLLAVIVRLPEKLKVSQRNLTKTHNGRLPRGLTAKSALQFTGQKARNRRSDLKILVHHFPGRQQSKRSARAKRSS